MTEEHIDPGPGEIASALALDYVAAGGGETFRGVRIRPEDGLWVYAERAAVGQAPERAVYRIDYADGGYVAHAYAVSDEVSPLSREPGDADLFDDLALGDLIERPSCAIVFERTGPGDYLGVTDGTACPPTDAAASHSVTEIGIGATLTIWTRDVNADGAHASGPTAPTVYAPTDG